MQKRFHDNVFMTKDIGVIVKNNQTHYDVIFNENILTPMRSCTPTNTELGLLS